MQLYRNGVLIGSATATGAYNSAQAPQQFYIGYADIDSSQTGAFYAQIDEVRVYATAFTVHQWSNVEQYWQQGDALDAFLLTYWNNLNLILYYPFEVTTAGGTYGKSPDMSGKGNDGFHFSTSLAVNNSICTPLPSAIPALTYTARLQTAKAFNPNDVYEGDTVCAGNGYLCYIVSGTGTIVCTTPPYESC